MKIRHKDINKDCRKFREMISPYLDGRLDNDEKKALELHLVSCRDCREEWESMRNTVALLHRVPQANVPRYFTVRESRPEATPSMFGRLCWASAIAALILVLLSAGDLFRIYPEKSTGPSEQLTVQITATAAPTVAPTFAATGKGLGLPVTEITPENVPQYSAQDLVTPEPGSTSISSEDMTTATDDVDAEKSATAGTKGTEKEYRWPVRQIELAVLCVAVIIFAAVIIIWRKGERTSANRG